MAMRATLPWVLPRDRIESRALRAVRLGLDSVRGLLTVRTALPAVLVVGLALRLSAVGLGMHSLTFQPDEDANLGMALGLSWGDLDPHAFYYPSLYWYLLFGLNSVVFGLGKEFAVFTDWTQYRALFDTAPLPFFLLGRLLSVVFGTVTLGLVYLLGRRLYSPTHGLVAAAFLAVSFLHARDSALATPDVAMTCFVVLSLLGAAGVLRDGRRRDYALAAVAAGLATAVKYNAVLVVGALVVAHALRGARSGEPVRRHVTAPRMLAALGLAALVFFAFDPYLVLDWPRAREGLAWQWDYAHSGQYLDIGPAWRYHLTVSLRYGMGLALLGLAVAGMARCLWRREAGGLVLGAFAAAFFLEMGTLRAIFVRYMTPLVPVLCLFAAVGLLALARVSRRRAQPWLLAALGVLAMLEPLHAAVAYGRLVHHVDTRVETYAFLQSLPDGLSAATYGPSVAWRSTLPRWQPSFYAKPDDQSWADVVASMKARGVRYVLIHRSDLDVFSPTIPELEAAVRRAGTLVRTFSPSRARVRPHSVYDRVDAHYFPLSGFAGLEHPGPLVMVYRLN